MKEIMINLTMNEDKDIVVANTLNEKFFTISYENKIIKAVDIYELLTYQLNNTYKIESNLDEITDQNDKTYFTDIVNLIQSIIDEINEMLNLPDFFEESEINENIIEEKQVLEETI